VGRFVQRYYDPQIGRFLSVDPVTAYGSGDMRHFNRYVYAFNNPYKFTDPDGRSALTKAIKLVLNGGNVAQTFAGVVSDAKTVMNPNASFGERALAVVSIASEAAPISIGDVKDVAKGARSVVDKVSGGAEKAVQEGRASKYVDATRGSSVSNRETNVTQESMQANLTEAGYKTSSSGNGSVQVMTNGEKSYVFRSDKPSVDFRNNGDASGKPGLKIRIENAK
jgi:uncharacterized protein RhaS with RHS repeats